MVNEDRYTDKKFWDEKYDGFQAKEVDKVRYDELYHKYLVPDPEKKILEVGCSGGKNLCYLAKKFLYQPFGIDYSSIGLDKTRETFAVNGLKEPVLFQDDFFAWQPGQKFDVVCSFGFVEHFADFDSVIKRQVELLAPGGILIIEIPHLAHLNYILYWLVDRQRLTYHNTEIMNLGSFKRALKGLDMEILCLSYYQTFSFRPQKTELSKMEKLSLFFINKLGRGIRKIFGHNRPNFLVSPHIICISWKKE